MSFIIGGSSSTGSSLLRNVMNRHSKIFCGPETYMFSYPELYNKWTSGKRYLLGQEMAKGNFWMNKKGVSLMNSEYGWSKDDLDAMIYASQSFDEFVNAYFEKGLENNNKNIWGEKTPANAYCFDLFLKQRDTHSVIHIHRDPYDSIASMVDRGFSILYAVGIYLFNTSFALNVSSSDKCLTVSYESMVSTPKIFFTEICSFLGVEFEGDMLLPGYEMRDDKQKHDGWIQNETHAIGAQSIGRFSRIPIDLQRSIVAVCDVLEIKKGYKEAHRLGHSSIRDLCEPLSYMYKIPEPSYIPKKGELKKIILKDKWARLRNRMTSLVFDYPLEIKSR